MRPDEPGTPRRSFRASSVGRMLRGCSAQGSMTPRKAAISICSSRPRSRITPELRCNRASLKKPWHAGRPGIVRGVEERSPIARLLSAKASSPMTQHLQLHRQEARTPRAHARLLGVFFGARQPLDADRSLGDAQPLSNMNLAAFRVRFSEFHWSILARRCAPLRIEEEQSRPFTSVLLYMEKLGIIDSAQVVERTPRATQCGESRV